MRVFKWQIRNSQKATAENITKILASNRRLKTEAQIKQFLNPSPNGLFNFRLGETQKAIGRLESALDKNEKIIVYSDYDADGICGTAILWETLYALGADVKPYIPDRIKEGYGFSASAVERMAAGGVKVIISVDHGITAVSQVATASKLGIDVILTDHHLPPKKMPNPFVLLHTTRLCGAGVAWKFAWEVGEHFKIDPEVILEKLSLAAIATVADLVPLLDLNRAIVYFGIEKLQKTERVGLLAVLRRAGIVKEQISSYEIGHVIAPRINAMGRIENAIDSLRLLCTKSRTQAEALSQLVSQTNSRRQDLTVKVVQEARSLVVDKNPIGVIVNNGWHEGVIGLVAGRLVEEFWRPMIVISEGQQFSKGSARSVDGYNIVEAIRQCSDILVNVGGHPMAAGFTIETKHIEIFKNRILEIAAKADFGDGQRLLNIDCPLDLSEVTWGVFDAIKKFEPFGVENEEPVFVAKSVTVEDVRAVGALNQHLKLTIEGMDAVGFGLGEERASLRPGDKIDLAYTLSQNTWNGRKSLQLKIKDFKNLN